MRHRTSTFSLFGGDKTYQEHFSRTFEFPNGTTRINSANEASGSEEYVGASHTSDFFDYSFPPLHKNDFPRFFNRRYHPPYGVHPCHHESSNFTFEKDVSAEYHFHGSLGFMGDFVDVNVHCFPSGGTFLMHDCNISDVTQVFSSGIPSGTRDPHWEPDWFALTDSFLEACDSFVPQSFFLGEDMVENDIFIDALKLVINPSRAVKTFIKTVSKHIKKSRSKNLGQIAKEIARGTANTNLFYQFGVRPAVDDIKRALNAHSVVDKRMKFLSNHLGEFVPIRAKTKHSSPVTDHVPSPYDPDTQTSFFCNYTKNDTVACISGKGQVRQDLTYGESWKAYIEYFGLNKVVGLAWELIPFSFVVDWFTNAQERLNSLTRLHTGGPFVTFKDICYSMKRIEELTLFAKPGFRYNSPDDKLAHPTSPFPVAKKTTVVYDRFLEPPDTSGVVDASTFGLFHSLILGCLTVQFAAKR